MANKYLVLGRAGSGKTHFVLSKFLDFVKEHKEKHALFLLPTRSQVEHLKDVILKKEVVRGFLDVSFFTFNGLARWVWESKVESRESKAISESAKDLLLKNILQKHRVKYFDEVYDSPGFRHAILKFIKELKENSLSPQQFEAIINKRGFTPPLSPPCEGGDRGGVQVEKCAGLVSIYTRFQQTLENRKLFDNEDLLNALFNNLKPARRLSGGNDNTGIADKEILLVDGFHDFTPIEFKILTLLIQRIPDVYITLALDSNSRASPIFQTAARTYTELSSPPDSRRAGLNLKEIVLLNSFRTDKPTLKHIEGNLFRKHPEVIDADDSISIIEATNIRDEVDQIARRIYEMVISNTAKYKDIGVVFRDVDKYCDLIENIFSRYGIPVRIYAYRALRENYAIKALRSLINIFKENWRDKWVIKVLKSDYFGLEKDLVDVFEHKALKKGIINSRKGWLTLSSASEGSTQFKQIQQFFDMLVGLENGIQTNQTPSFFREWFLNSIANLLMIVKTPTTNNEQRVMSNEHALLKRDIAAIRTFTSLLDDVVRACEIERVGELRFHEFIEMLLPLLDVATYRIKDKRDDVVNVIDAMEARQWELPIVFVGGLLEREFPKQVRENLFLKDRIRRELNAQNGIHLKEELKGGEEERYLFYIAVTRAKEKLFLTYPATNDTGNKNLPSFFLLEVKKLFTKDSYERIVNRKGLSQVVPKVENILTSKDLKDYVFYQLNAPYRKGGVEEKAQCLTCWFYNQLRIDKQFIEEIRIALEDRCNAFIDDNSIRDKLKGANICYSATQLNDYAQCPFLHFYKHILKLEKPPSLTEDGLDNIRQGIIIHKTLEKYLKAKLVPYHFGTGLPLSDCGMQSAECGMKSGEVNIFEIFERVFDKYTKGINIGFKELKIKGELETAIKAFIEAEEVFTELYKLKPLHIEAIFGSDVKMPIVINDEEIGAIRLQGKIDRIDVAEVEDALVGVVLDYKYSKNGFNKEKEEEILQGLDLQLPIYLLAARRLFHIAPIGAEFYTLKTVGRSGLLNKDFIEKGILPSEPPKSTKMLDTSQFESLIEDCKNRIIKYVREIINGNIVIKPANPDRCGSGRCDFADVCRFEKWMIGKTGDR